MSATPQLEIYRNLRLYSCLPHSNSIEHANFIFTRRISCVETEI